MDWTVFQKPGAKTNPEPKPVSPKPMKQPTTNEKPAGADKRKTDLGEDIDPAGLSDEEKQCWAFAVQNYTGQQDPQQWAMYWSQKEGMNFDCLLRAATVINNVVLYYNAPTIEQVPEPEKRRFPWWSAFRNVDPNTNPLFNTGSWSPSQSILGATMGNRFIG